MDLGVGIRVSGPRVRTRSGWGSAARSSLPPGAEPWTCACLLDPPNQHGEAPYSGNEYGYEMRRHHIVFAVDREGYAIEEWLQHDEYLAPPRGSGLGELWVAARTSC